ncbi:MULTISPECIES: rhodanese-like domain-containing protein [Shewanella]|uniref:Rhodanese-like domain-containing protein n=2 Tax=Shewanella TaxID=22 RepID=A0A975AKW2_9GAMM|nr:MULTISPECIES: rhodanese-like domain-containing protein [Shewanella]QSX30151.1 rhodanese-like domain-containing protein [Shewanella cyperi]QSX37328.1 rhodanese-like domain-containing protein [Shewanella sedimentimangrovi]QSX40925.1 rhodanese-like domain-containing protein [Shewanella cyperi]
MQEYIEFFRSNPMLSLAWAGLFMALIVSVFKSVTSKVKNISHQELVQLVNKQGAKVVDVRGKEDFRKGHIVDALNISMAEIKNNQLSALESAKTSPIILVCNAGMTSSQAAQLLVKQGFEQVFNLKGGMGDWQAANMPVSKSKR